MTGSSETGYCATCGAELPGAVSFCPDCGSENPASGASGGTNSSDYKEWALGFDPGGGARNYIVGLAYLCFWPFGIALLLFGHAQRGKSQRRQVYALTAVVVIAVFAIGLLAPADTTNANPGAAAAGGSPDGSGGNDGASENVDPRLGSIDVDIQHDIGQNTIGYDVVAYFEDSARLTVQVTDGVGTAHRTFEASTSTGVEQEFNDDIDPPDSLADDETFRIQFVLTVDGEVVDRRTLTETYSE